ACWRIRTSPGPGSPTARSTSFISSGPPAFSIRIVGLLVVEAISFSQSRVAVRYRARADETTHARPESGHCDLVGGPALERRDRRDRAAHVREQHCRRTAARPGAAGGLDLGRRRARARAHAARRAASSGAPALGLPRLPGARRRAVRAVLELRRRHADGMKASAIAR